MKPTTSQIISQFKIQQIRKEIALLQASQWEEFSFNRVRLISQLKLQLKTLLDKEV